MKLIAEMSQIEIAAWVHDQLKKEGINVVLSGGSAVAYYSGNLYVSKDIDMIIIDFTQRSTLENSMKKLAFHDKAAIFSTPIRPLL